MRASFLIGAAIVGCCGLMFARAASRPDDQGPDLKLVEQALQLLSKGERSGLDVLTQRFPPNNITPQQLDVHARLIRLQVQSLGEPCGIELVGAEGVGESVRGFTYLGKHEDGFIRWRFNFYRPKNEWKLYGYSFDTDDKALFSASGYKLPNSGDLEVAGVGATP